MPIYRAPMRISRRSVIKKLLVENNYSIDDLAKGVGFSYHYVSAVINGRSGAVKIREKIAEFLGVTVDDIFPLVAESPGEPKENRAA
jgi:transcriptional regulator with XRE-family HTH domain